MRSVLKVIFFEAASVEKIKFNALLKSRDFTESVLKSEKVAGEIGEIYEWKINREYMHHKLVDL